MNRLAVLLAFTPLICYSQGSWVNVTVQADQYSAETTWEISGQGQEVQEGFPYSPYELRDQIVLLPAGDYTFTIYDAFGDGICCGFGEGWFSLSNTCGLDTSVYNFDGDSLVIPFTLEPCQLPIPGCMDESSNNYNPWATVDNGSCNVSECPEGQAFVSMELTLDNWPNETGFTLVDLAVGEFYEQVFPGEFNFGDQLSTYTYDFCVSLGFELILTDTYGDGLNGVASGGVADGGVTITACSDSVVWELEDIDFSDGDGTVAYSGAVFVQPCPIEPPVVGCMDDDYIEYNPEATEMGDCITLHTWGCMDSTAFNYDSTATISDLNSPCVLTITLEDDAGDGWGNSHVGIKQGDLQWIFTVGPEQFSKSWDLVLDSDEEVDVYYFEIGSPQQPPQETEFQTLHNSIVITNESGDTLLVEGDNPFFDNGQGALQPFSQPEWNIYHFTPYCGTSCIPYLYGCTDEEAQNFDSSANTDDGTCYYSAGCTQAGYLEYYNQGYVADYDDGSCETLAVFGCTDPEALNYSEEANVDNESCIPVVIGCMDIDAFNYDPEANTPDNDSCLYDAGCVGDPGDPYWANDYCYLWVIDVDPYCCEGEWDEVCQEMYGYCESGVTSVSEYENVVRVYPNPTSGRVVVYCPQEFSVEVYSLTGQRVNVPFLSGEIDLTDLPSAPYQIVVRHGGRVTKKRIVKQ